MPRSSHAARGHRCFDATCIYAWTSLVAGIIAPGAALEVTSEMNDGGVAFGDGIEDDRLELPYGMRLRVARAELGLRRVV